MAPHSPDPVFVIASFSSGRLVACTEAARKVLELGKAGAGPSDYTVVELLGLGRDERREGGEGGEARRRLKMLVQQSTELPWGGSVLLEYYPRASTEGQSRKAEVLVASSSCDDDEDVFSILFLRPADTQAPPSVPSSSPGVDLPKPSAPTLPAADLPPSPQTISSSQPAPSATPSIPVGSPTPTDLYSSVLRSGTLHQREGGDNSAVAGSSSSTRRRRPATGEERRTQPVPAAVTEILYSITGTAKPHINKSSLPLPSTPSAVDSISPSSPIPLPQSKPVSNSSPSSHHVPAVEPQPSSSLHDLPVIDPTNVDTTALLGRFHNSAGAHRYQLSANEEEARQAKLVSRDEAVAKELAEPNGVPREQRAPLPFPILMDCLETLPQKLFIADGRDGQIQWFNTTFYNYVGRNSLYPLSPEDWAACFHQDDLPNAFSVFLSSLKSGEPFKFEYRVFEAKTGRMVWHECAGRPHRNEAGEITMWYASISDIDELVTTRHDALLVHERVKAVLAGSEILILTVNNSGIVTFCEGKRPAFLSISASEPVVGRKFEQLWTDAALNEEVRKVLDEECAETEVEAVTVGKDGQRHYHRYRLVPLVGDPSIPSSHPDAKKVSGVIIVERETTALVLAEEKLQRTRAQAARAQANELAAQEANRLKTEFLTTVSHEIRTPIASILGICELLLGDQLSVEQRNLVEKAIQSGENLLELVGTVLDVRKVETGELQLEQAPFLIADIVDDARVFKVAAEKKGLEFIEDVQPYFGNLVLADRLRLRQILANALSNAVKFTNEGSVSLHLRQLEETDSSVTVEFIVEDTGVGISPEVLPTLFVPFRQADTSTARQFGGSGLGLTIARKLVELMGGTVDLTSPGTGLGSRMTVVVPLVKAPPPLPSPPVPTSPVVFSQSGSIAPPTPLAPSMAAFERARKPEEIKVLLAEDNALIREIVTKTLRKMKFSIFAVNDGRECVEQVEKDDYDVILMDGQMPVMDGYAATAAIRKHSNPRIRKLRIIALTASAIAGDMERCLQSGMDGYLAKPVRAKELEAAIWSQVDLAEPLAELVQ